MPALTPDVTPSAFGSRGGGRVRMPCMRKLLQPTPLPFGEMEKSHPRDLTSSTPGMLASPLPPLPSPASGAQLLRLSEGRTMWTGY